MSNYTETMIADLRASAPFNLAKAKAFAEANPTVNYRSVISKVKSLGLEYEKTARAAKSPRDPSDTKAATLAAIRSALSLPEREGDLTKAELSAVLENLG